MSFSTLDSRSAVVALACPCYCSPVQKQQQPAVCPTTSEKLKCCHMEAVKTGGAGQTLLVLSCGSSSAIFTVSPAHWLRNLHYVIFSF